MAKSKLRIVLPAREWSTLGIGLHELTKAISALDPDRVAHGFLGGEFGYGAEFENEVFMMHPFCWCEREDCPWCGGCDCPPSSVHYLVDGKETDYQGWMDFYFRHVYGMTEAELKAKNINHWELRPRGFNKKSAEANRRRTTSHDPVCDYCTGKGIWATHGAEAEMGAPNFWHKPSGLKVWWYKYIGRDMKTRGGGAWINAIQESIESLSQR